MDSLNTLIQSLETMVDAHSRLLDLAKGKRDMLVNGNIQDLQSQIHREALCVDEIQKLEQIRMQKVQEFFEKKGIKGDSFTLEELIKLQYDNQIKVKLTSIAKQLRSLIQEISQINENNQQLIQTSLSFIQYSIGMFAKKEPAIGYGPNAKNRYTSMLDAKI
ncbi:flagellar biosynthesis/type III secretory pathway chaperone [Bacillus sp. SORGH_AS 510]|uniref:flagellar protein FlgN n=1 Tax=Bacillus sp. SORGH_AS_0510 TaxID=3041771 RepID=UPI00277D37EB|nr:flagellar protein FlgN [Bacillus sp. SORGH_AS_0510]MDQ1146294.1 flagellar biosynthesis/type III secretory pathway chaperone [Bacillus sp. SORGH_AS_0510]